MKVHELIQQLQKFDKELEVVLNWDNPQSNDDLAFIDTVEIIYAVDGTYKGFYRRVNEDVVDPKYPEIKAKEYLTIR